MQGPQSSTIKATITMFHQSPFTEDSTEVQKGMFSFDIAFTSFLMPSKAADTLPNKSAMYTQDSTLITAQVPPCAETMVSLKMIQASPYSSSGL